MSDEKSNYRYSLKYPNSDLNEEYIINDNLNLSTYTALKLFLENKNFYDVFKIIKEKYSTDVNFLIKHLTENDYITMDSPKKNIENSYDIKQMKELLKKHDLNQSGSKNDLVERIAENIPLEEIIEINYEVSKKGRKFFNEDILNSYTKSHLEKYNFTEFVDYYLSNKDNENITISFLEKHEKLAFKRKEYIKFLDCLAGMGRIYYMKKDYENALKQALKIFIININPIFLSKKQIEKHQMIDSENLEDINELSQKLPDYDFKLNFSKIWKSMKFKQTITPMNSSYKYLIKAINGTISYDLKEITHQSTLDEFQ